MRILITAGPTWVPVDKVRVIGNIATGKTGALLAGRLAERGNDVTLLLGPVAGQTISHKPRAARIRVERFRFFSELSRLLRRELSGKRYDIVIHSAAVSDYRLSAPRKANKIKSGRRLVLRLEPTSKLGLLVRRLSPQSLFVAFKLEIAVGDKTLRQRALEMGRVFDADIIVANVLSGKRYRALILNKEGKVLARAGSREEMVMGLMKAIIRVGGYAG